ncbi:MAG: hypothetical protein U0838_15550 [Chloroflexota bacterium]
MAKKGKAGGKGDKINAAAIARWEEALGVAFDAPSLGELGGDDARFASVGDEAWVALQLEQKHSHPVENALQYWRWLERSRRRMVLVHAIAANARRKDGPRTELTLWLGAMMERVLPGRFAYCRVELGSADEAAQIAAAQQAIEALRQPMEGRSILTT